MREKSLRWLFASCGLLLLSLSASADSSMVRRDPAANATYDDGSRDHLEAAQSAALVAASRQLSRWVDANLKPNPPRQHDIDLGDLSLPPIPMNGESYGRPDHGRLRQGVRMPDNRALYLVRRPEFAWGSSHTVRHLQLALASFRAHSAYRGAIVVSDMSRRWGGRYGPHRSHQSGRDADLWLPLASGRSRPIPSGLSAGFRFASLAAARASDVDWRATWGLVKALIRTGEVQYIFLSRSRQRRLLRAAIAEGYSRDELAELIQFPRRARTAVVRHSRGHDKHMHVRFRCAPYEHACF